MPPAISYVLLNDADGGEISGAYLEDLHFVVPRLEISLSKIASYCRAMSSQVR